MECVVKLHIPSAYLVSAPQGLDSFSYVAKFLYQDHECLFAVSGLSLKLTHHCWCSPEMWEMTGHHWRTGDGINAPLLHPAICRTILGCVLCLCFSNIREHQNHPKSWLNHKLLNSIPRNGFQVRLRLLVQNPCLENHCSMGFLGGFQPTTNEPVAHSSN